MDILTTLRETFFDPDAMRVALPELLRVVEGYLAQRLVGC